MMMNTPLAAILLLASIAAGSEPPAGPALGRPVPAEVTAAEHDVFPDGAGLPPGAGTARRGQALYDEHCLACHGPEGEGGSAEPMAGASSALTGPHPVKTIGNYWPYAPTLYDLIRRSMPMGAPGSLDADETYALTAYILYLQELVDLDAEIDAAALAGLKMPNRDGFLPVDAAP